MDIGFGRSTWIKKALDVEVMPLKMWLKAIEYVIFKAIEDVI